MTERTLPSETFYDAIRNMALMKKSWIEAATNRNEHLDVPFDDRRRDWMEKAVALADVESKAKKAYSKASSLYYQEAERYADFIATGLLSEEARPA